MDKNDEIKKNEKILEDLINPPKKRKFNPASFYTSAVAVMRSDSVVKLICSD